jgi:hypothetical protein
VDTNTYSVPAEYASAALMLKLYPDCLCVYHQDKLIARHLRRYDRHQDFEHPDHPRELLQQRRRASDQKLLQRLLALTPRAQAFYQALAERRLNVTHHVRKIVALSEIYGTEKTARAITDALEFEAFSCEYIANLLEQRQRLLPEAGALHLTRRADLLELELPEPNLSLYDIDDFDRDDLSSSPADLSSSLGGLSNSSHTDVSSSSLADLSSNPADPNPDGDSHEPGQER